jgi:hypothetical protein
MYVCMYVCMSSTCGLITFHICDTLLSNFKFSRKICKVKKTRILDNGMKLHSLKQTFMLKNKILQRVYDECNINLLAPEFGN